MGKKVTGVVSPPAEVRIMSLAVQMSFCSKDPVEQVGAVITDKDNNPIAMACNDKTQGIINRDISFEPEMKSIWMNQAAFRVIKFLPRPASYHPDYRFYTTHFPCLDSIKQLAENGVKHVIYGPLIPHWYSESMYESSKQFCEAAYIKLIRFEGNLNWSRDKWQAFTDKNC